MKKKSNEELGTLVTREMKSMLQNDKLSKEQRFDILAAIMFDIEIEDNLLSSFADSLKTGFEKINADRYAMVEKLRESKREYERKNRTLAKSMEDNGLPYSTKNIEGNGTPLKPIEGNGVRKPSIPTNTIQNKTNISPLNPPLGIEGESDQIPPAVQVDDLIGLNDVERLNLIAARIAEEVKNTTAFAHMRVNDNKLRKCLISILKKNGGAERAEEVERQILSGIANWTGGWEAENWAYAPGRITDFLYDGHYLQEPRKKAAAVGAGCGECGVDIA